MVKEVLSEQDKRNYAFGDFRLEATERVLLREGKPVPLTPKAFDVLLMLVEKHGHIVEKNELMDRVWADAFVEEGNLKATVSMIRRALGDGANEHVYVETVPRRGYRFIAAVTELGDEVAETAAPKPMRADVETVSEELTNTVEAKYEGAEVPVTRLQSTRKFVWLSAIAGLSLFGLLLVTYFIRVKRAESKPTVKATEIKSIAVLPFKSLVANSGDEYLELGITDTLITRLSGIREMTVRPTSAVRKYGGTNNEDPIAAGSELKAESVLEGNIQRLNDRIRVTARLLRVSDGAPLWAGQFDEKFTDIFSVEDTISKEVANALVAQLSTNEQELLSKRYTQNSEAYRLYLEGRYFWNKRTSEGNAKAIEYFNQAIASDTHYALAYSGLADCYNMMGYWNLVPPREAFPKAKEAAIKALEIDDTLGEAHASLAYAEFEYDWDFANAERGYKKALELNPNHLSAHQWYAEYLMVMERFGEADEELKRAQMIDPLSLPIRMFLASKSYELREYDQAIRQLRDIIEIDPNFTPAYHLLGTCYFEKGMRDEAVAAWLKGAALEESSPANLEKLKNAYEELGLSGYWQQEIVMLEEESHRHYVSPIFIAMDYALLGDKDHAFGWLEKALEERSGWLLELKFDPEWDNLRTDPRFEKLIRHLAIKA